MDGKYDLSLQAKSLEQDLQTRRRLLLIGTGLGAFMVLSGLTLLAGIGGSTPVRSSIIPTLLVAGTVITLVAVLVTSRLHRPATELVLDSSGLGFRDSSGASFELKWTDPGLHIDLLDWRSIPPDRRSGAMRQVDFILTSNVPLDAVLPYHAVLVLLDAARSHGLKVVGWHGAPSTPGPARIVRIRP